MACIPSCRENIAGATKYVNFSNESSFKGKSDLRKFEKARVLKTKIKVGPWSCMPRPEERDGCHHCNWPVIMDQ